MKGGADSHQTQATAAFSRELEALCPPPQLLPGENLEHYHTLQAAIFCDLAPQSAIEWLLAIDIVELSWEMQRYRMLRQRVLAVYRQRAVEISLRRIDIAAIAPEIREQAKAELYIIRNALDWRLDPKAANDIEARLASHGVDQPTLSMETFVEARETLSFFETMLSGAQIRRILLLKEFNNFRRTDSVQMPRRIKT